jgi:NAD(P)-dependent dehydrogenase (short-subunit alcohol dehydrogenase family)
MTTTKIALVTGANKGIGKEIARQLGRLGMTVRLGVRDEARGRAAAAELAAEGIDARPLPLDVTDEQSVAAAAKQLEQEHGQLDVLVNNAGVLVEMSGTATADEFRNTFATNVIGPATVTRAMIPLLRKGSDPRVVNLSSELGSLALLSDPDSRQAAVPFYAYNSSKAALNVLTVMLANELRADGIKVNSVCPGFCATDMNNHQGTFSAADGARVAVRLATVPTDGPTGEFHGHEGPLPW